MCVVSGGLARIFLLLILCRNSSQSMSAVNVILHLQHFGINSRYLRIRRSILVHEAPTITNINNILKRQHFLKTIFWITFWCLRHFWVGSWVSMISKIYPFSGHDSETSHCSWYEAIQFNSTQFSSIHFNSNPKVYMEHFLYVLGIVKDSMMRGCYHFMLSTFPCLILPPPVHHWYLFLSQCPGHFHYDLIGQSPIVLCSICALTSGNKSSYTIFLSKHSSFACIPRKTCFNWWTKIQ